MRTFEIPTANGYVSVQANSKQDAIASVPDAKLNKPQSVKGVNFVTPDNVPTQAFDSSKNISIKPQATSTGAQGMSAQIESMAKTNQDTFTRNLEERAKQLEADRATSKDIYLQSLLGSQGEKQLTQEAYAKTVDPLEQELTDINNQIMAEQNAVRRRLQELDKNPQGLFGGALQDEKNRVERESLAKQADLSVIQMARQGKYDSAKEIADRAIQVRLEQQQTINEALKFNYDENKELFTKAEQRAFETAQADRERQLNKEETIMQKISDISIEAIKGNAPSSVIQKMRSAKTPEEAYFIGRGYIRDLDTELKKAQIDKTLADAKASDTTSGTLTERDLKAIDSSPQGKKLTSLSNLYQLSSTYKNLVDTYGFKATGPNKTLLDNAYADLKIAYKEAANLGALTGPDVNIIEEAIKPASGATNYLNYKLSGGRGGVSSGIEQALGKARREALQNYKQLTARNSNYSSSDYVRSLISPFAKNYSTTDIDNLAEGEIIETDDGILLESLGNGNFSPL